MRIYIHVEYFYLIFILKPITRNTMQRKYLTEWKRFLTENTDNPLPPEQCLLDDGYKYALPGGGDRTDADWESQKTDLRKKGFFMKKEDGNSSIIVKILPMGFGEEGHKIILSVKGGTKIGFPIKFKFTTCDDLKQRIAEEIDKVNQTMDTMPFTKLYTPRTKKNPIPRGNLKL